MYTVIANQHLTLKKIQFFYMICMQTIYIPPLLTWILFGYDNILNLIVTLCYTVSVLLFIQLLKLKLLIKAEMKKIVISKNGLQGARINFCIFTPLIILFISEIYRNSILLFSTMFISIIIITFLRKNIASFFTKGELCKRSIIVAVAICLLICSIFAGIIYFDPNSYKDDGIIMQGISNSAKWLFVCILFILGIISIDRYSIFCRLSTYFWKNNVFYKNDKNNEPLE